MMMDGFDDAKKKKATAPTLQLSESSPVRVGRTIIDMSRTGTIPLLL